MSRKVKRSKGLVLVDSAGATAKGTKATKNQHTTRWMPAFNTGTWKLISSPRRRPVAFRYDNSWLLSFVYFVTFVVDSAGVTTKGTKATKDQRTTRWMPALLQETKTKCHENQTFSGHLVSFQVIAALRVGLDAQLGPRDLVSLQLVAAKRLMCKMLNSGTIFVLSPGFGLGKRPDAACS